MKKLTVLFLLFSSVACYGEIVSEVSFNPSRMGDYKYLKVADSASLVGGLETQDLNISSGGTVTMELGSSVPQNFTITQTVNGASGSTIDMPTATFSDSSNAYIPDVYVRGGKGTFTGGNSVVNTMNGNDVLLQKAKTLNTLSGGTVEIVGKGGNPIPLHSAGTTTTTKGFWLHGNDIPTPVGTFLDGATSISKCKLTWEDRTTAETSPKKAKVLVLSDCTISGGGIPFEPIDPAI